MSRTILAVATVIATFGSSLGIFEPGCETCCQIDAHDRRSAQAGLAAGSCRANKGYWGTLNSGQEDLCATWAIRGPSSILGRIQGLCEDGTLPSCADGKKPKCSDGTEGQSLGCPDGSQKMCADKTPPTCSNGDVLPLTPSSEQGEVWNDVYCSRHCRQHYGLCMDDQTKTDKITTLLLKQMLAGSKGNSTTTTTGSEAAKGGEAAKAAAAPAAFRSTGVRVLAPSKVERHRGPRRVGGNGV